MPFSAIHINLEIVIMNEVRERQISYDIAYTLKSKKKGTNELIYKTERVSENKSNLMFLRGEEGRNKLGGLD